MVGIARLIHPKLFVSSMVLLLGGAACACWEATTAHAAAVPPAPVLVIDGRKHVRHKDPPRYFYPTAAKPQNDPSYWPYPTIAGAALLGIGVWRRRKANDPEGGALMSIPQQWDEEQITGQPSARSSPTSRAIPFKSSWA